MQVFKAKSQTRLLDATYANAAYGLVKAECGTNLGFQRSNRYFREAKSYQCEVAGTLMPRSRGNLYPVISVKVMRCSSLKTAAISSLCRSINSRAFTPYSSERFWNSCERFRNSSGETGVVMGCIADISYWGPCRDWISAIAWDCSSVSFSVAFTCGFCKAARPRPRNRSFSNVVRWDYVAG